MDILQRIMAERRQAVAEDKARVTEGELLAEARQRTPRRLQARLQDDAGTHIIAEMKKASPSAGLLRPDYDPAALARAYSDEGACGLSVLTEPHHFQGSGDHIRAVREVSDLPILRKDFMCDPYQVLEAAAWGADVILLIVAALDDDELQSLYSRAQELGMDVLVEAHTSDELRRGAALGDGILGVNSRDLKTLTTNLAVARGLASDVPRGRLSIAESGIKTRMDIESLERLGFDGFLVGEALVSDADPAGKLKSLRGEA